MPAGENSANLRALNLERRRARKLGCSKEITYPPAPLNDLCYTLNSGMKADIARGRRWARSGREQMR